MKRTKDRNWEYVQENLAKVDSLIHWSQNSNKAKHPKHIFEKYRIYLAGLQEVYRNWAQLPQSKTLARILHRTIE